MAAKTKKPAKKPTAKAAKAAKTAKTAKTTKKATAKPTSSPTRRDRPGHIATKYGAELLARSGVRDRDVPANAFLASRKRSKDDLAEQLGEEFVSEVTSGENLGEDILNQEVPEERGGPFVITTAQTEFAFEPDKSNPRRARREPFPRT